MSLYQELVLHASAPETVTGNGSTISSIIEVAKSAIEQLVEHVREAAAHFVGPQFSASAGAVANDYNNQDMRFYLDVTAHAGTTPTLNVTLEGLIGGVWHELGAFTEVTTTDGAENVLVVNVPDQIREVHTITGSVGQSYTFSVHGVR